MQSSPTAILRRLWNDEQGAVQSIELVLIATVAVIGLVVGLATMRNSLVSEISDSAAAVGALDQSYTYTAAFTSPQYFGAGGVVGDHNVAVTVEIGDANGGSAFEDNPDFCEDAGPENRPNCLEFESLDTNPLAEGGTLTID